MKRNWHKALIFNKKVFSRVFGMQLAWLAAAFSLLSFPTHAFDYELVGTSALASPQAIVVTTDSQYEFPLEMTIGMSQGFGVFHPGVDLRAPKGTNIVAMGEGIVIEVEEMRVGYGHFVRIAHQGTLSTLYAHLDKVSVKPGQKVSKGENIGTVGLTGWSTGPHLHFEVHLGNKSVNPLNYI